jgi:type IV pilus assembly protein PilA
MLHRIRQDERGFTLIELLVVILIIGILAAIALPSFLNQRGKAQDTEAKSAARTAQTAMETWYTDEQNYNATEPDLVAIEAALGTGVAASTTAAEGLSVTVNGTSNYSLRVGSKTGNVFIITKAASGAVTRTCTAAGSYGCPRSSNW